MAAIGRVAAAIGCTVTIEKITRCSNDGATLADFLSKGRFTDFRAKLPSTWMVDQEPAWIPPSILGWIHNPVHDAGLGESVINDMLLKDSLV